MSFRDLAKKLCDLTQRQPMPTDEQARQTINEIIAQAMRMYRSLAEGNRPGFSLDHVPKSQHGDQRDYPSLHQAWRERVVPYLKNRFGERVPENPLQENPHLRLDSRNLVCLPSSGSSILNQWGEPPLSPWPYDQWLDRIEKYFKLLILLNEMAEKSQATVDPDKVQVMLLQSSGFTLSTMVSKVGRSASSLRRAAKRAHVKRAERGSHGHIYSWQEVLNIAKADFQINPNVLLNWEPFFKEHANWMNINDILNTSTKLPRNYQTSTKLPPQKR